MPLNPHQSIDHYEIIALIGSGGMGEVYRARDTRLNRDVAIKILPGLSTADSDRLRRFEQEARAAAALNHPNILAVYQMGSHQGHSLPGVGVAGRRNSPRQSEARLSATSEGRRLRDTDCEGAGGGARKGNRSSRPEAGKPVSHERWPRQDTGFRPGAVDAAEENRNWGQSSQEVQTMAGMLMGSMGYMSPEQVRGQPADQRSDIIHIYCGSLRDADGTKGVSESNVNRCDEGDSE